ncbi:hypothetical protein MHSWG343_04860 [Candidatus Mycoplasma haematohominis]|uniref:Uncharacterized protein n=1 Tax=Candidatus Mycoplasma haematohominis TaxID=1494318 RepID=A0A478FSP1_9MOLU|nr:hypothetical protein MHSWG343_04860 [Candidatus Mycoplasma haemohominis]
MDPTKLAVGTGAAILVASGGYGVSTLLSGGMPSFKTLKDDPKFGNNYSDESKVGKVYGYFLVAPYGSRGNEANSNQKESNNEEWWKWSYARWKADFKDKAKKDNLSNEFKDDNKVGSAFSITAATTGAKPLNQVCEDVYKKKNKDEVTPDTNASSDKSKLSRDMWKYCSSLGTLPEFLKGTGYGSGTFGVEQTHKDKAVATKGYGKSSSNDEFWRLRNDEFFGSNGKEGTGKDATETGIFKTLYDKKRANQITDNDTVKNTCEQIYSRQANSKESVPKIKDEYIKKFCYLTPES